MSGVYWNSRPIYHVATSTVDYNRQLDEIASQVFQLVLTVVQQCLITKAEQHDGGRKYIVGHIFKTWEQYKHLTTSNGNNTLAEQNEIFKSKLKALSAVISTLPTNLVQSNQNIGTRSNDLITSINRLTKQLKSDNNLNAGGIFNWVDSIFVKCLRNGTWLLIDNVNFCSPAVLDRLNGVLEPGGKLIIGERGVNAQNELETITPHSDFRLFLTMDPKHGEISRAMRNRGVEIYMMDTEQQSNDFKYDWMTILHSSGIKDEQLIKLLIQVHYFLHEHTLGEKPNTTQLSHTGYLISQEINRGLPSINAITSVIHDVYIRDKFFNCDPKIILDKINEKVLIFTSSQQTRPFSLANISYNPINLQTNPEFLRIKLQTNHLLQHLAANNELLRYKLTSYFQSCDAYSMEMRERYLLTQINEIVTLDSLKKQYTYVVKTVSNIVRNNSKLSELPLDLGWLPQIQFEFFNSRRNLRNYVNPMIFQIYYNIFHTMEVLDIVSTLKPSKSTVVKTDPTILEYMVPANSRNTIDNVVLRNILSVINLFHELLLKIVDRQFADISNRDYVELLIAVQWYFRLIRAGNKPMFLPNPGNITPTEEAPQAKKRRYQTQTSKSLNLHDIDAVSVNLYWFVKYCVTKFIQVATKETQTTPDYKLFITILKQINESKDAYGNSSLVHISKHYKKIQVSPRPYITAFEYEKDRKHYQMLRIGVIDANLLRDGDHLEKFRNQIRSICKEYYKLKERHDPCELTEDTLEERTLVMKKTAPIYQFLMQLSFFSSIGHFSHDLDVGALTYKLGLTAKYVNSVPFEMSLLPLSLKDQLYRFSDFPIEIKDRTFVYNMRHQMMTAIYEFIENSAHKYPTNFIEDLPENHNEISFHAPNLTYHLTNLLFDTQNNTTFKTVSLATYDRHVEMLSYLQKFLWVNSTTIAHKRYDSVLLYTELQKRNFLIFVQSLKQTITGSADKETFIQIINNPTVICALVELCVSLLRERDSAGLDTLAEVLMKAQSYIRNIQTLIKDFTENIIAINFGLNRHIPFTTCDTLSSKLLLHSSGINTILGYSRSILTCSLPPLDPIILHTTRRKYFKENCQFLQQFLDVYKRNEISEDSDEVIFKHELYYEVEIKLARMRAKLNSYVGDITFMRPINQKYSELYLLVTNFLDSQLHEAIKFMERVQKSIEHMFSKAVHDLDRCNDDIEAVKLWLMSKQRFIQQLDNFDGYPDIVLPIKISVGELAYGLETMKNVLQKLIISERKLVLKYDLNNVMVDLIQFPRYRTTDDPGFNFYLWNDVLGRFFNDNGQNQKKQAEEGLRLVLASLLEEWNIFHPIQNKSSYGKWSTISNLFTIVKYYWKQKENEKDQKQQEEESLYKVIERQDARQTEETEEQATERIFASHFFESDFEDIVPKSTLEAKKIQETTEKPQTIFGTLLSDREIEFVCDLHESFVKHMVVTPWICNDLEVEKRDVDYEEVLEQKGKTFTILLNEVVNGMNHVTDRRLLPTMQVLLNVSLAHQGFGRNIKSTVDNVYHDKCLEIAQTIKPILSSLKLTINQFLITWPDHPTLKTIIKIIDRLENFEMTSPLVRFLTGFELLLAKCWEWQQNASKDVSILDHITTIQTWIISNRKFEFKQWFMLLDQAHKKVETKAKRFWFFMTNLIDEVIYGEIQMPVLITPKIPCKKLPIQTVRNVLDTFLTSSPIGEFRIRLQLVYNFHCHIILGDTKTKDQIPSELSSLLWNLYKYYKQFLIPCMKRIAELRTPIEKTLKDFIKINEWHDINYWSVKESIEKARRVLLKNIRKFEEALKEPLSKKVMDYCKYDNENFSRDSKFLTNQYNTIRSKLPSEILYKTKYQEKFSRVRTKLTLERIIFKTDIISSHEKYQKRLSELVTFVKKNNLYKKNLEFYHDFIIDLHELVMDLRRLEIDSTLPKEKQKSQAKSILQQKRKALTDVFKSLKNFGFSYQVGQREMKLSTFREMFLMMKPLDVVALFLNLRELPYDNDNAEEWIHAEGYCLQAINRFHLLQLALKIPSPQLGIQNIERIRGFSASLMLSMYNQKQELTSITDKFVTIRTYLSRLEKMTNDQSYWLFNNNTTEINQITQFLNNTQHFFNEIEYYFNTSPNEIASAYLDKTYGFIRTDGPDELERLQNAKSAISKAKDVVAYLLNFLKYHANNKMVPNVLSSEITNELLNEFETLNIAVERVTDYVERSVALDEELVIHPLYSDLGRWKLELSVQDSLIRLRTDQITAFEVLNSHDCGKTDNLNEFVTQLESSVLKQLIAVQNLYQKYAEQVNKDEEVTEENLLKTKLIEDLDADLKLLNLDLLIETLKNLHDTFIRSPLKLKWSELSECLHRTEPLFEEVRILLQYFMKLKTAVFRNTCKLSYFLFDVSNELAKKGFCVPEEFDDGDDDGNGDGQDGGGGMGLSDDVTGSKDVSDRIESEDQLEDAKKEEDYEKKDENKDDQCKEEGGIEMSDDFEGNLQDVEKEDDDDSDDDNDDDDAEKQMGETGEASDKLDERVWGDEHEEDNNDEIDDADDANNGDDTNEQTGESEKDTKGKSDGDKELGANTNPEDDTTGEQEETEPGEQVEKPDINEMKEPEFDEDQINPHHGKDKPLPEPEDFDMPEDLNLDDGNKKDEGEEGEEENPFDVDKMKENMPEISDDKDETTEKVEETEKGEESEDDDQSKLHLDEDEKTEPEKEEPGEEKTGGGEENKEEEKTTPSEESLKDKKSSAEENIESEDQKGADNVQSTGESSEKDNQNSKPEDGDTEIDQSKDKEGVGQSKTEESKSGHSGEMKETSESSTATDEQRPYEQRQKPGDVDSERSLGNTSQEVKKKLRVDERTKDEQSIEDSSADENKQMESEHYQHIKESKKHDAQILDAATKEQIEQQEVIQETEKKEEVTSEDVEVMDVDEIEETTPIEKLETEKIEKSEKVKQKYDKNNKGDEIDPEMEIEGDIVETQTVARGNETTYHTQNLSEFSEKIEKQLSPNEEFEIRLALREKLNEWTAEPPSDSEAKSIWSTYSTLTSTLAHDLCEQLRLILEPTQTSRLKGDYRTGRRINMRKVIPYIASQFRKDKIWLRRTKPSKREYQIVIAIDDSQSMLVNQANQLAFESLALLSSALTLLECGEIGVLSFGEQTKILHRLGEQFTDDSGARILQEFTFEQKKTLVENMVGFTCDMFKELGEMSHSSTSPNNAKLLVIISDGRGISKDALQTVRRARNENIFMVFVIIDNPSAKDSILDMRRTNFDEVTNKFLGITPYLEQFPFPFYVILRDINQLPSVLSDALRQWFELITETS